MSTILESGSATPAAPQTGPLLEVRDVTRVYGAVHALNGVSLHVHKGEILGLIGENGAGKSTLLNIISGTDKQTSGSVLLKGQEISFSNYNQATRSGVFRIFQELALVQNMTVWENLFLSHEKKFINVGLINRREGIRRAKELLRRFDHGWIDPERKVQDYPFAVRQVLEVLKAFALADLLGQTEPVILLDEPTAALAADEIEFLRDLLLRLKDHCAIIFVSHRLSELLEWSDRIVVFKDGQVVAEAGSRDLTEDKLHFLMVGRERDKEFYREDRQRIPASEVVLRLEGFSHRPAFRDVDLVVQRGEIVGMAGVLGSGKTELGQAVFGDKQPDGGSLEYRGRLLSRWTAESMAKARVGYVPSERKEDGLLDTFSVAQNISFARIVSQKSPWLHLRREAREAERYISELGIKAPSPHASIESLSGGNQQKVVLARWLVRGVDLLILDNPTRGVDAGAKEGIYDVIRDLADAGVAILLISDDLLEVIGLSNKIVVMKDGAITYRVDAPVTDKPKETDLVATMV
ncbi:sugar ABC transporter ATP-binding protein [Sinomonas sp. ASV486]|uniref:sugar ABC transporter ATP-binding protein n=1 Tax=Sinomonas sp. ASV486 TaxID=3051170 RepID=UPI0027DC5CA9|nr:sugar ABC transporter ATP-binding protein [Sinomonas sp. ASV486]MDQ4490807.1 sugar ABC transporter ATP-binding protein [Sinomonas sp. ASV486]